MSCNRKLIKVTGKVVMGRLKFEAPVHEDLYD